MADPTRKSWGRADRLGALGLALSVVSLLAALGYTAALLVDLTEALRIAAWWVFLVSLPIAVVSCAFGLRAEPRGKAIAGIVLCLIAVVPVLGLQFVFGV